MMFFDTMSSPVGVLTLAADEHGLRHIEFPRNRHPAQRIGWQRASDHPTSAASLAQATLTRAMAQLGEYFEGQRRHFDLVLRPSGTPFQCLVWQALATIPYGATWSYRALAETIGQPAAMRAVGAANGRNPLPIVLPCHRVIGANGSLVGFGGGLDIKAILLRLEGAMPGDLFEPPKAGMRRAFGPHDQCVAGHLGASGLADEVAGDGDNLGTAGASRSNP